MSLLSVKGLVMRFGGLLPPTTSTSQWNPANYMPSSAPTVLARPP